MLHPPPSSPHAERQPPLLRYAVAAGAAAVALLLSALLRPLVEPNPFLFFVAAIAVSAWYGGLGPGLLVTALAVVAVNYLFIEPVNSFQLVPLDALRLGAFALVAALISSLSESRRGAERAAHAQREQLRVTLASIGDAVIATDTEARVTFLNGVAAALTGWEPEAARGQPVDEVFRIVNAATRRPVESPVARVLREGVVVGLANHTVLLGRDGVERPIDDSGAPIRDAQGRLLGVVLVFRDITEREQAEAARAELLSRERAARAEAERGHERAASLAEASRALAGSLDYEATLRRVAGLMVPRLADWCVVDLLDDAGALQMVATAHVDPAKVAWAEQLRRDYPVDPDGPAGTPYVVRTGEPQLFPDIPDSLLVAVARTPDELRLLREVGYRSVMVVPLRAGGRVLGALSLVIAESERRYDEDDLAFAQELASRAAVAIENARLYRAAQDELARRQQAEAAQRTGETQLRLIADALPVLISYLDRDLHYRFNNQAYEEWFGEARANVTGRHIVEVVGEAAYAGLRPRLEAALAGETVSFESLTPYRSGGSRHIHATYVPDRGDDGAVHGLVVLVEDITARKRAEEGQQLLVAAGMLLAASLDLEATLQQVARLTIPALADYTIIYVVGADGQIVRSAGAHGDPVHEALLASLERDHPLDPASDIPVARVLRTGESIIAEGAGDELPGEIAQDAEHLRLLRELGPRAFLAVPMRARGRTLGALLCVATRPERRYTPADLHLAEELALRAALAIDNTNLYRATEQARDDAERAAGRIARLQQVTAALGATMTPEQVADLVVREGLAAVGADAGAVFLLVDGGRTWEAVSFRGYPPELVPRHVRSPVGAPGPLSEALETRGLVLVETPEELVGRWPHLAEAQGRSGDAAAAAVPILLDQEVLGVLYAAFHAPHSFSPDDTSFLQSLGRQCAQALDRARLYAAEREARASAEEAIRLRDLFLSVASHELKTPLTSLLLQTQLLQRRISRDGLLAERERQTLQVVADQAQRLDRLIAALLDISRLELGQLSLNLAPVDLCDLARRAVAEIQPTSDLHSLTCRSPEAALVVMGDELRLEQVLQNLLQNAIKYSPDGGPVEVEVEAQGGQVCVTVSDRGIGLPDEALPRLFERFYRASNADPRQISGMGIGLYVVKEIARLHGGSARAAGREGGGSSFSVCLPLAAPGAGEPARGADGIAIG